MQAKYLKESVWSGTKINACYRSQWFRL